MGDNSIFSVFPNIWSSVRLKNLHLFTSNIIFSRVASVDICNDPAKVDTGNLSAANVLLSPDSAKRERLRYSYCMLLARILCTIPAFQTLRKLLPDHIPHEYARNMSAASKVCPLPIVFTNEAKHEDGLAYYGRIRVSWLICIPKHSVNIMIIITIRTAFGRNIQSWPGSLQFFS